MKFFYLKYYITALLLLCSLPACALTLNGSVDCSVDIEQPKMEFDDTPVLKGNVVENDAAPVDFSGGEQNINLMEAKKRVDNDILEKNPNTTGYYYNNGQIEYIGVKVNKHDI